MLQSRDVGSKNGWKNKTDPDAYEWPTLHLKNDRIEKHHTNECQKKAGVAIFVSEKNTLKKVHNKRQRRTVYNSKWYNPKRRYNNCKYIPQLSGIYSQATKVVQEKANTQPKCQDK